MAKRITAILLALCLLCSAVLCFAEDLDDEDDSGFVSLDDDGFDDEEQKTDFKSVSTYNVKTSRQNDFVYRLTDDGKAAILTSYTGENSDVVFPAEVENRIPVIAIDTGMCQNNPVIVNVRIPGSVRTIGNVAFSSCPNLKSVTLEEGLLQIGMCCFGGCPELTDIKLPDSLEIVDNFVFAKCAALEEVVFGTRLKSIGMKAFFGCENLVRITVPGGDGVAMGDEMFLECPNEVEIVY